MKNNQIDQQARELKSLLKTIIATDKSQAGEQPEEVARRLVFEGWDGERAIAAATKRQAEMLVAPVQGAIAEKRLGDVLESLQGILRAERDKAMGEAQKALTDAFKSFTRRHKDDFDAEQMDTVFTASTEWRSCVEAMDRAGRIPLLLKATFPFGWSCLRFEPIRAGDQGIEPRRFDGEHGSAFDGLVKLAELLIRK